MLFYLRTSPTTRRCSRVQAINSSLRRRRRRHTSCHIGQRRNWCGSGGGGKSLWCRRGLRFQGADNPRKPHDVCHLRLGRKPTTCAMLRFRMLLYVHRTPSGTKSISSEDPIKTFLSRCDRSNRLPYRATMSFQSIWY